MPVEETIAATVTSHHFPGDAPTAPHRQFRVQPHDQLPPRSPRKVISDSDLLDQGQYLVEQVEAYRIRTGAALDSSIEVMMPVSFFSDSYGSEAYDQLWSALLDAYEKIDPIE